MSILEVLTSHASKIDNVNNFSHNHGDQKCYLKTADGRKGIETDYDFNSGKDSQFPSASPHISLFEVLLKVQRIVLLPIA